MESNSTLSFLPPPTLLPFTAISPVIDNREQDTENLAQRDNYHMKVY